MKSSTLRATYDSRCQEYLDPISTDLVKKVSSYFIEESRIDRITSRVKSIDSFLKKAEKANLDGSVKYKDPLNEIQDQIGVRIICFYKDDAIRIQQIIKDYFTSAEEIIKEPDGDYEFGYFGIHMILTIPSDIRSKNITKDDCPETFELQIKTLYQHAWAEANHDIVYKPGKELTKDQKRKVAFTAAQSWGADEIFNELAKSLISTSNKN
jgi:ppGpp synthetase/RelA/SpoT-type nucleotidyltranferase